MVDQVQDQDLAGSSSDEELVVTIHNEDEGGEPFKIQGNADWKVKRIIHRFYEELGSAREEKDRMTCLGNGNDVFAHEQEELGKYAHEHCHHLEWGFSRETGGA